MDSIFYNTINFFSNLINETRYIKLDNEYELNSGSKFTDNDSLYTFVNRIIKMKKIYQSNDSYENINLIIDKNIRSESYFQNDFCITLERKLLFDILDLINIFEKQKCIYYKYICKVALFMIQNNKNTVLKKNTPKVLQMCNSIYYLYNYYYHLINNYSRYKKGYYYSISKKKAVSLCEKNRNKIYEQHNQFYVIKQEFDVYLDNFFDNWIDVILKKNIEISFYERPIFYYFKCFEYFNLNTKLNLQELVNSNYIFLNYECEFKYIEPNYFFDENYFNYKNNMENEHDIIDIDLFPIFFYFMNKKYPNMTDESGIAYENYYIPIPIFPLI